MFVIYCYTFVLMIEENKSVPASISLSQSTLKVLDEEARKEIRTRSNMVEVLVLEALEARKNKKS